MALPKASEQIRDLTVDLSEDLTVTFQIRLIPAAVYEQILEDGRNRRFQTATAEHDEAVAAHSFDPDNTEPPGEAPAFGLVEHADIRVDVLAAGIVAYYSNVESARQEFTREDAEAIETDWPHFARDLVYESVRAWSTEGPGADPFARFRRSARGG